MIKSTSPFVNPSMMFLPRLERIPGPRSALKVGRLGYMGMPEISGGSVKQIIQPVKRAMNSSMVGPGGQILSSLATALLPALGTYLVKKGIEHFKSKKVPKEEKVQEIVDIVDNINVDDVLNRLRSTKPKGKPKVGMGKKSGIMNRQEGRAALEKLLKGSGIGIL